LIRKIDGFRAFQHSDFQAWCGGRHGLGKETKIANPFGKARIGLPGKGCIAGRQSQLREIGAARREREKAQIGRCARQCVIGFGG
jgi:hypothetical protein